MEMEEEEQKKTVPREIIKELDVIYIPFKTPIHTLQFPT